MVFRCANSLYPVHHLRSEMDRLLSGFLGNVGNGMRAGNGRNQPAVNIWEDGEAFYAELEIPGVKSDEVDVSVVGDELSVKVCRPEIEQEDITFHRRERAVGSFNRLLRLPLEVDAQRVEAELRHGVLTITLPKAETAKPRKINVSSAN